MADSRILARLQPKERDVARLVAKGLPNKEIARQLHTTEQVVKNYCRRIYDLVGCDSKLELAVWLVSEANQSAETELIASPEKCMRCGCRHYRDTERQQCGSEALHAAIRHLMNTYYKVIGMRPNWRALDRGEREVIRTWAWVSSADGEAARMLENLWLEMRLDHAAQLG